MKNKLLRTTIIMLLILAYNIVKPVAQESQSVLEPAVRSDPPFLEAGQAWADSLMETLSLEDRIAKHFFQEGRKSCTCPPDWPICQCGGQKKLELVNRRPITADDQEVQRNPASRSAKLRVVEKV